MTKNWNQFNKDVKVLARKITREYNLVFTSIAPLFNDDIPLALLLSSKLGGTPVIVEDVGYPEKSITVTLSSWNINVLAVTPSSMICLYYTKASKWKPNLYGVLLPKKEDLILPWHDKSI